MWWPAEGRARHAVDFREVAPAAATADMFVATGGAHPRASARRRAGGGGARRGEGVRRAGAALRDEARSRAWSSRRRASPSEGSASGASTRAASRTGSACLRDGSRRCAHRISPLAGRAGPRLARATRLVQKRPRRARCACWAATRRPSTAAALARRIAAAVRARGGILTRATSPPTGCASGRRSWAATAATAWSRCPPPSAGGRHRARHRSPRSRPRTRARAVTGADRFLHVHRRGREAPLRAARRRCSAIPTRCRARARRPRRWPRRPSPRASAPSLGERADASAAARAPPRARGARATSRWSTRRGTPSR